jgi:hypothetical protein
MIIHFLFFRMNRLSTSESSKENCRPPLVLSIESPGSTERTYSRDERRGPVYQPERFAAVDSSRVNLDFSFVAIMDALFDNIAVAVPDILVVTITDLTAIRAFVHYGLLT